MKHSGTLFFFSIIILWNNAIFAQIDTTFNRKEITFDQYLMLVAQNNIDYAAAKYNVSIAAANREVAKIYPDPVLSVGRDGDVQGLHMPQQWSAGVSQTIPLGGKRKARINLANSQLEFTQAQLVDFFRNLRADASILYVNALTAGLILQTKIQNYQTLREFTEANEKLFTYGTIKEVDIIQSRFETRLKLNEVFQAQSDLVTALLQLAKPLGRQIADTLYYPAGSLNAGAKSFNLNDLLENAKQKRADLVAALRFKESAANNLTLVKANRMIDLNFSLGLTSTSLSTNMVAPQASDNAIALSLAIPLKFSNKYKGDLQIARYQEEQSELLYKSALLTIEVEMRQAFAQHDFAKKQVMEFNSAMLDETDKVLQGKIYSYQRGENSLLEVLSAQQTKNNVFITYYQSLQNYATALINLQRAAGIWDVQF